MSLIPNEYRIILKDPNGAVLVPKLDTFAQVTYTRGVIVQGALTLKVIDTTPDSGAFINTVAQWSKFLTDGRIEVWVSVNGASMLLDGDTCYYIRKLSRDLDAQGHQTMTFVCEDTIGLLMRAVTVNDPASAKVDKAATYADNLLKTIFTENFGAGAVVDWSSLITVAVNQSLGAQVGFKFPGRPVLHVMQDIAQASTLAGTYLAFDIFSDGGSLQFRTYTSQRGIDRRSTTGNSLLIGPELGNVSDCHFEDDHSQEATYVVAGTQYAKDATREGISPFGRIMRLGATNSSGTVAQMLADAQAGLRAARNKKLFTAHMIQTEGCLYRRHYTYGDYLTAQFWGQTFDCHLDAIQVDIKGGKDTITALLRSE